MKLKYIIYSLLLIAFCSLVAYRIVKNKGSKEKSAGRSAAGAGPANMPPLKLSGIVATPARFENTLTVTGSIDANEQVEIKGDASGLVRGIYFREGSNVHKGQLLLKIDDSELRAQLLNALTKQNLAAENERRARLLLDKEAISREEYDAALAELRSMRSQSQLVRAQIAKTEIRAPFSGRVGLRNVSVGEYLTQATGVSTLVSLNPVKITFSVPEKYSTQVKTNTQIQFSVAGTSQKYRATVYAVEPRIESASRTLLLRARADNSSGRLIPGAFANIQLPLSAIENAILIPSEAIIPVQSGKKVFITDGRGKAKETMVETSTRTEKEVLISSGLKTGDTVITSGIMSLKEGNPVKVQVEESRR